MYSELLHKHLHDVQVLRKDSLKQHINTAAGLKRRKVGPKMLPTILQVSRSF